MNKLLPCPHCGHDAASFTKLQDNWHQVVCGACGCRGNEFPGSAGVGRPKAAASWNARPKPESATAIMMKLSGSTASVGLLEEIVTTLRHARKFIDSREKMHPDGVRLYDELLDRLNAPEQNPKRPDRE